MPDQPPHARNLRTGRYSEAGHVYLVAKCVDKKSGIVLTQEPIARCICEAILHRKRTGVWHLLCFVLMPDHMHLLLALGDEGNLSAAIGDFGKYTARCINGVLKREGAGWQKGFHDRMVRRSVEKCPELTQYIHGNPVRRNLCETTEDWPWSTAHPKYAGEVETDWFW